MKEYKYLAVTLAFIALLVGAYLFGGRVQYNKDIIAQDKAINDQKTADSLACQSSKQTGATIGEKLQGNLKRANSDYDDWVQRNSDCAAYSDTSATGRGSNGPAGSDFILPKGTRLVNTIKYGKTLRDADYQRGQVISLQECVRQPQGCKY